MEVQVRTSSSSYTDDDQNNLKQLLEVFASVVSLEDIASVYCETGRNLESTSEILCSIAETSFSKSHQYAESSNSASSGCPSSNSSENGHIAKPKPKKSSLSIGTVSNVIGKDYMKPRTQSNGFSEKQKPVKINSDDFPVSEIWDEKNELASTVRGESMDSDTEEFLYKMLGKGFQLEESLIQDVIGQCGYNMSMSIDKLVDLSAATLERSDDVIGIAAGNVKGMKNRFDLERTSRRTQPSTIGTSTRLNTGLGNGDELKVPQAETKTKDIEREVLEALFTGPERFEEKQEARPIRPVRRSPYGQIVTKPRDEMLIEDFTYITRQPVKKPNDEANQSYDELREAVMEYWVLMAEYYKAAVDAYTKNNYESWQKLLEEGNFYMKRARELDELSAKKLTEGSDEEEEFSINMHVLDPRDALHHFKLHLTSFCGLSSIRYMKLSVGTNPGDSKDRKRKRLVTKLLEREGIPWTEEGGGWVISIRSDEIDPDKLSFANK